MAIKLWKIGSLKFSPDPLKTSSSKRCPELDKQVKKEASISSKMINIFFLKKKASTQKRKLS